MNLINWLLLLCIAVLLAYAIYDEIIIDRRNGKTLLKIPLLRRVRMDGIIFSVLLLIVLGSNIGVRGAMFTNWLTGILAVLTVYLSVLRQPVILFKQQGFFFNSMWTDYQHIQHLNLSQDGVLVADLEKRRLFIRVRHIDDLEKIYNLLINIK